jgi:hypothetical protein
VWRGRMKITKEGYKENVMERVKNKKGKENGDNVG